MENVTVFLKKFFDIFSDSLICPAIKGFVYFLNSVRPMASSVDLETPLTRTRITSNLLCIRNEITCLYYRTVLIFTVETGLRETMQNTFRKHRWQVDLLATGMFSFFYIGSWGQRLSISN